MAEQRLWAPWRMKYVQSAGGSAGCIFCDKPEEGDDRAAHIVARTELSFVMLNAYPYTNGHLMVAAYEHVGTLGDLAPQTLTEIMATAQTAVAALDQAYHPEGYNIGFNQGKVAGAGVEHHLHLHIVPRWGADTNFMPVIGDTHVLPQALEASWEAVRSNWPQK